MKSLPVLKGKALIKLLEKLGFAVVRINGSHHRMRHADGRVTTIPVHGSSELPKGLLRKIIREDLKMDNEQFNEVLDRFMK